MNDDQNNSWPHAIHYCPMPPMDKEVVEALIEAMNAEAKRQAKTPPDLLGEFLVRRRSNNKY
jgi:hypothetical protein